jgi:predicted kinase
MKQTPKLLVLRGISASGKTTYAKQLQAQGWVCVEKDEIRKDTRLFKDGQYNHKRGDEGIVIRERDRIIRNALRDGKDVVSSDTNLNPSHIKQLQSIARQFGAEFEVDDSYLAVPLKELIERDKQRDNAVGEVVIRKQFHDFVKTMPTFLQYDSDLPWLVVSDVDGTLTNGPKDRGPYDWAKVGQDEVNLGAAKILDGVRVIDNTKIFLMSGRSEECRPETEDWLERNDIEYDALFMRPVERISDKDYDIKAQFVEDHIRGQYNVLMWLDDRPQVCRMLRDVYGINVFERGDPYHEF